MNYKDVVVPKPWGHEYLLFDYNDVAGWVLNIHVGEKTSLHCHPKKKTSLIVLCGTAKVSFLSSDQYLNAGDKIIIRPGVFHSTTAVTALTLLEVETPVDKGDLVRLKDSYGREGKPYESIVEPKISEPYLNGFGDSCNLIDWQLKIQEFPKEMSIISNDLAIILKGGICKSDILISGPGDSLTPSSFNILMSEFDIMPISEVLYVSKV